MLHGVSYVWNSSRKDVYTCKIYQFNMLMARMLSLRPSPSPLLILPIDVAHRANAARWASDLRFLKRDPIEKKKIRHALSHSPCLSCRYLHVSWSEKLATAQTCKYCRNALRVQKYRLYSVQVSQHPHPFQNHPLRSC